MGEHEAPDTGDAPVPGPPAPEDPVDTPPDGPRPEPVLDAAKLAGVVSGVVLGIGGLLKLVGVLIPKDYDLQTLADQTANAVLAIGAAWALIGPYLTARFRARDRVTPLESPRDVDGRKLVPEQR